MQVLTLWKLQAAWNSYSGVPQLIVFLQTVQFVFEKTKRCPDSLVQGTSTEPMQRWAAGFLADLMDVFFRAYPEQFWTVLRENPTLQAAVFERRAANLAKNPEKYVDLDKQVQRAGEVSSVAVRLRVPRFFFCLFVHGCIHGNVTDKCGD